MKAQIEQCNNSNDRICSSVGTTSARVNDCISYYIGGGWGDENEGKNTVPAYVIRGTDIPALQVGEVGTCPLRHHKPSNFESRKLEKDDIIFEVSGGSTNQLVGRSILFKERLATEFPRSVICASFCKLVRCNKDVVFPKWFYYWLQEIYNSEELGKYQIQSTGISNFQFEAFVKHAKLQLPDLPTQERIADILSAYDDLIENNNKRIALLEKAAKELYKEWFVRFRFPGHETVKFENGLPKGWEVKRISDLFEVTSSKRVYLADYVETGIPFYRSKEIIQLASGQAITECLYISESAFSAFNSKFGAPRQNDILITSVGTIGVSYLVDGHTFYFKDGNLTWIKSSVAPKLALFLYSWLNSNQGKQQLLLSTIGTSQSALTIENLKKNKLIIPTNNLIDDYYVVFDELIQQKRTLQRKNQNLAKQRDLLLPRLMSGKLEV